MIPWSPRSVRRLLVAGLVLVAPACGDDEPAAEPEVVVEEPTPRERLQSATDAWNATDSFHFVLTLQNRVLAFDQSGLISISAAEGDAVAPDRLQAQTTARTPMGALELALISIGEEQWITDPLTRRWTSAPAGAAGAVAGIFDPATGIGARLMQMTDVEYFPGETLDRTPVFRLSGTLPGSVMADLAPDLAAVPVLNVDLFVTPADNRIRRVVVRQPATPEGSVPTWTFDLSNFGQPVTIAPPL